MNNNAKFFLALFMAIVGFSIFSFTIGVDYGRSEEKINCIKKPSGYTVLDADHVIMSNGDTVRYQWNNLKK